MLASSLLPAPAPVFALLTIARAAFADDDDRITTAVTTAPVYLPAWDQKSWSLVRGSVIDEDSTASQTTYTIFCPESTPPACGLSLEFPFELVEGPDTVEFHGTYTSTYIVNLGCTLEGTTSAECSGYSSFKSGYSNGFVTGPTEMSWTSTMSGSDVEWGVLTMGTEPTHTDDFELDEDDLIQPTDTGTEEGDNDGDESGSTSAFSISAFWAGLSAILCIALVTS